MFIYKKSTSEHEVLLKKNQDVLLVKTGIEYLYNGDSIQGVCKTLNKRKGKETSFSR